MAKKHGRKFGDRNLATDLENRMAPALAFGATTGAARIGGWDRSCRVRGVEPGKEAKWTTFTYSPNDPKSRNRMSCATSGPSERRPTISTRSKPANAS